MNEQALQALIYLAKNGISRLGTDAAILERMTKKSLIEKIGTYNSEYKITPYGKASLREIERAGTDAMINRLEAYLK